MAADHEQHAAVALESTWPFKSSRSKSSRRNSTDSAGSYSDTDACPKAALLAMIEVQHSLELFECECNKACLAKDPIIDSSEWSIPAHVCGSEEEICTEIMTPANSFSLDMRIATSIKPNSPDLYIDFDSHYFGFWKDVGVDCCARLEDMAAKATLKENTMPWDL